VDIKVAVIGGGYWGKNLIRNFHALGSLYAICDSDKARLALFQKEYPEVEIFQSTQALYSSGKADAVVIASPAESHYSMAKEAFLHNKDIFVEKPLSLSVDEGVELNKIAQEEGVKITDAQIGEVIQGSSQASGAKTSLNNPEQRRLISSFLARRAALDSLLNL